MFDTDTLKFVFTKVNLCLIHNDLQPTSILQLPCLGGCLQVEGSNSIEKSN
jgi:hypothetical protein